jgi:16S rRNA G966 N2-methylase RsmD
LIVLEEAADQDIPDPEGFVRIDTRTYGDTQAAFYRLA